MLQPPIGVIYTGPMLGTVTLWGAFHILLGCYGLWSGRIPYIHKQTTDFLPSLYWADRSVSRVFFYIVLVCNLGFGGFLFWYARFGARLFSF